MVSQLVLAAWLVASAASSEDSSRCANPSRQVVLLVPAEISPKLDSKLFSEAVGLYATQDAVGSVVMSNLPETVALTPAKARAVGETLGGCVVAWPLVAGAGLLEIHVLDLQSSDGSAAKFSLEIPEHPDRGFYRLAALKLQSALRSLPRPSPASSPASPPAQPPALPTAPSVPPQAPAAPTGQQFTASPAPARWLVAAAAFGTLRGTHAYLTAGLSLTAGYVHDSFAVGGTASLDLPRTRTTSEGQGSWSTARALAWARLRLWSSGWLDAWAELGAGATRFATSGTLAGAPNDRASATLWSPTVNAGMLLAVWPSRYDALVMHLHADGYVKSISTYLRDSPFFESGRLAPYLALGYQRLF